VFAISGLRSIATLGFAVALTMLSIMALIYLSEVLVDRAQ
jgi:hypothetical protein